MINGVVVYLIVFLVDLGVGVIFVDHFESD
jgi:hypothetical protein